MQIQVERELTFEDICPDFSRIIAENGGFMEAKNHTYVADDGTTRKLLYADKCIVGEAHGN